MRPDTEVEMLLHEHRYEDAELLCRARAETGERHHWLTQIGYVCFLNEEDDDAFYNRAIAAFRRLLTEYPHDVNARFWVAYLTYIALSDKVKAEQYLRKLLAQDPDHPYANLVISGIVRYPESVQFLKNTLRIQPGNLRALRDLTDILAKYEKSAAEELQRGAQAVDPYVETGYGIMNRYMNEVFTGAAHGGEWQD